MTQLNLLNNTSEESLRYLEEISSTGTGGSFTTGQGENYATPIRKKNNAVKYLTKLGFKEVKRRKRPFSTKLVDYL